MTIYLIRILGDEDNGEQGAWFVLSALGMCILRCLYILYAFNKPIIMILYMLGLYVTTPGTTEYVLG